MIAATSSGSIELYFEQVDVLDICRPGDNEPAVKRVMAKGYMKEQLDVLPPIKLRKELWEHGAWETEELLDHEQNKARLVWVLAWDLFEEDVDD